MANRVSWNELTELQKEYAIYNYAAIREAEEEAPCDPDRAKEMAPLCRAYYVENDGSVTVDI